MAIFADPLVLTLIMVLVAIAAATVSKRAGILIGTLAIAFLYLIATPFVSGQLIGALELERSDTENSSTHQAAAIIILGGDIRQRSQEFDGDTVGRLSLERIRYGAYIYREAGLPVLTTGGGIGESGKSVARVMAEALRNDYQVPVRWIEERARNTFENAQLSAKILRAEGIDTVYLVTHSWHMPRSLEAFQQVGLTAIARPTGGAVRVSSVSLSDFVPHSGALRVSAFAMHEWVGRYWYRIRFYR